MGTKTLRRAGKRRALPGYMWAHTHWAYGTQSPPTAREPAQFCRAWVWDYLHGTYPHGLCDECGAFDTEDAADIIVRTATETHLADTDYRDLRTADSTRNALTAEHLAHLTFRLITACETEITAQETGDWPWRWVIDAHASECPAYLADAAEDAYNRRCAYGY